MKRMLFTLCVASVLGVLLYSVPLNANTFHVYVSGNVTSFGNNEMTVDKRRFLLSSNVRVAFHDKKNGSYFESKGKLSDVKVGQPVIIKAEGSAAHEILIERWKQ
jgi:hypothetical protein